MSNPPSVNQFSLLRKLRFYPLFWTQFGGAFNDNLFKSALLMLFTYGSIERWGLDVDVLNNIVAAALIIPFLLFAPSAGRVADYCDKSRFIVRLKIAELAVMAIGALALWSGNSALLLFVVFCTGTQSACFSPLKYAVLPQHLPPGELTAGNGILHTGTSLAVFLGLIAGTVLMQFSSGALSVAVCALLVAWLGWRLSRKIPPAPAVAKTEEPLRLNPLRQIVQVMGYAWRDRQVFWSIVGVSWYWFLGSVYLTQLPNFSREVIHGAPSVVSVLLVLFMVGVCTGALLCNRLSRGRVEPAVVPLGAFLIVILGIDFAFAGKAFALAHPPAAAEALWQLSDLVTMPHFWRIALDLTLVGVAGGLYIVPLQAMMQERAEAARRAQIIAANNVLNALFMIAASVFAVVVLGAYDLTIPDFFLITIALHFLAVTWIFCCEPVFRRRFIERFLCW